MTPINKYSFIVVKLSRPTVLDIEKVIYIKKSILQNIHNTAHSIKYQNNFETTNKYSYLISNAYFTYGTDMTFHIMVSANKLFIIEYT